MQKRALLSESLPKNSLFFLKGKSGQIRNGDVYYPFRQDSHMLLLTGLDIPDLTLIGYKMDDRTDWVLYSDTLSDHEILWGTPRLSHTELASLSGIDDIRESSLIRENLRAYIEQTQSIYTSYEDIFLDILDPLDSPIRVDILSIEGPMRPIRMMKSPEEIEYIRRAISITKEAYEKIRAVIKPKMYEYEVESHIAQVFRTHHTIEAYPTIVASGQNACTLHYTRHTSQLLPGNLLLVDFGAEYRGYAADITRIFALDAMSIRQRAVYESVLRVRSYAESQIRPGIKKSDYESLVRQEMNQELKQLGLMPLSANENEVERLSRIYYPHSTSHFLGLDVHDVGERDTIFAPGMVITCEPGIYIREESIGIRLEDDILITNDGCENLSQSIPL